MFTRRGFLAPSHALARLALGLLACSVVAAAQDAPTVAGGAIEQPARAARAIPRGTILSADDIMILGDSMPRSIPLGWITRRLVQPGEELRPPAIARSPVVQTGAAVTLRVSTARISGTRSAVTLEAGAPGDTIRVRLERAPSVAVIVRDSLTVVPVLPSRP
jgi:flagella basal body P-ring formation protein FlgA